MLKWKKNILKSDFRFSSYFVLDFTYIIYTWTIMILKTKNATMGKKNSKKKQISYLAYILF
jgi:hypothetical protein